jgi:ADP-heptose:LPS heptosyltransferase
MTRSHASQTSGLRPVRLGRYRYSKLRWRISVRALDLMGAAAMRLWRTFRSARIVTDPRRILLVQLDHLGDAVLTSPLLARLRAAYPNAVIDVLASASNQEVFEADPNVDRVHRAEKTWFERRRGHSAMFSAVWSLGRTLRDRKYDLGIDVRGDILTVIVLALAGIPRRAGWAMGGGAFLLTDVAEWIPGRHEVRARLALLETLGAPETDGPARVVVHPSDADRVEVAHRLRQAWPELWADVEPTHARESATTRAQLHTAVSTTQRAAKAVGWDESEPDWLHAGRFGEPAPILAAHLGAGTAAKRWPPGHWKVLIERFLEEGWRVVVVGGPDDADASAALTPSAYLVDWTGTLSVTQTAALLERADLFIGADSGPSHIAASAGIPSVILFSGTNRVAQWRPWSRRSLVIRHTVPCGPCHQKACPLSGHPCMRNLEPERVHRAAHRWWSRLHREESPHAPL